MQEKKQAGRRSTVHWCASSKLRQPAPSDADRFGDQYRESLGHGRSSSPRVSMNLIAGQVPTAALIFSRRQEISISVSSSNRP
jgi:hypothetical protein